MRPHSGGRSCCAACRVECSTCFLGAHACNRPAPPRPCARSYHEAKAVVNSSISKRMHHMRTVHPYQPFPVDRIVAAAKTVALEVRAAG